jgi:hypothetical protein
MTDPLSAQPAGSEHGRLDLHNASVDGPSAAAGHCGMTDLHTGRVCQEPAHHVGSCDLVAPSASASRGA